MLNTVNSHTSDILYVPLLFYVIKHVIEVSKASHRAVHVVRKLTRANNEYSQYSTVWFSTALKTS